MAKGHAGAARRGTSICSSSCRWRSISASSNTATTSNRPCSREARVSCSRLMNRYTRRRPGRDDRLRHHYRRGGPGFSPEDGPAYLKLLKSSSQSCRNCGSRSVSGRIGLERTDVREWASRQARSGRSRNTAAFHFAGHNLAQSLRISSPMMSRGAVSVVEKKHRWAGIQHLACG